MSELVELPRWAYELAFVIYVLAVSATVVVERRRPTATLALVLGMIFVPVLGLAFYLLFSRQRARRRKRLRARRIVKPIEATRALAVVETIPAQMAAVEQSLVQLALATAAAPLRRAQSVRVLSEAPEIFAAMAEAIDSAERYIHAEFYIWRDDATGRELVGLLTARARRGVRVRVLLDHLGSLGLPKDFFTALRDAGGQVAWFGRLRIPIRLGHSRLNYRNHRKLLLIDGHVGFVGGINVGDEYSGRLGPDHAWRDLWVGVEGDASLGLETVFLEDWLSSTGQVIDLQGMLPPATAHLDGRRALQQRTWRGPSTRDRALRAANPYSDLDQRPVTSTGPLVQVIPSGPDAPVAEAIAAQIAAAIGVATKRAWLVTPYFIPDEPMMATLRTAAMRGVDVRLVVPCPDRNDSALVAMAAASYYDDILDAGGRIWEYQGQMLHAKYFIIDDLSAVGSANLDVRSFYINYEIIAMFYDVGVTASLAAVFTEDLAHAHEILGRHRDNLPWRRRVAEGAARVLSPLL